MDRKDIILQAAFIIRDEGYDRLTLSYLAQKLGVRKASLYYHFDSKDRIISAVYDYFEKDCLHLSFTVDLSQEPEAVLESAVSHWSDLFTDRTRSAFISLLQQRMDADQRAWDDMQSLLLMLYSQSEAIISNMAERGSIRTNNPQALSHLFASSLTAAFIWELEDPQDCVKSFLSLFSA